MNLTITHYNNFFKVTGILNRHTIDVFQQEFQDVFERLASVTISIEGLESIDKDGVKALAKLHNESIARNKQLSIIGFGCKDLYDHFKASDAA
ncbi:hypothetical protein OS188_03205 [Xanthomarina sp. F1114]|uniref:hypothetical protein n=1 Tax=Xanthomarina sp. F1114 TaxID=2996019 RepID=UPI00225DCDD6|nr:hypothetical protein [Xanthomarina sp. F1114]MCX7546955.1 hypothetical protein [Xanthomarina sp. F1114]